MFPQPGVPPDVYANRAIERTYPALNATTWLWDDMPGRQRFMTLESTFKEFLNTHRMGNLTLISRIGQVTQWSLGWKYRPNNTIYGDLFPVHSPDMVSWGVSYQFPYVFPTSRKIGQKGLHLELPRAQ
jgi:hypothetical protein